MIYLRFSKRAAALAGAAVVAVSVLIFAGCETSGGRAAAPKSGSYLVSAQRTLFYRYGPAQASGPDQVLAKGQKLTVVKREFGYSRVQLDDGQPGYISTEDLTPMSAETAASSPAIARKSGGVRKREREREPVPETPREAEPPLPIPESLTPGSR
jgi:uncharacterized protein YgiM (DUF1202 family)